MIEMRSPLKRSAAVIAERALRAAAPLLVRRGDASIPSNPRVLVVRCDHIGDAVMATAVLRPLREGLAAARLDVLAGPWAAPLFTGHPAVDEVIVYGTPWWSAARGLGLGVRLHAWGALPGVVRELRRRHYDVVVELRGDLRQIVCFTALSGAAVRVSSDRTGGRALLTHVWRYDRALHEVEKNVAIASLLVGAPTACPELPPAAPLDEPVRQELATRAPDGYLAMALRGSEPNRSWPAEHAAALARVVRDRFGLTSVYLGAAGDGTFAESIAESAGDALLNLAGRTTLPQTLTVLAGARAAAMVDSGPMHLAAAAGVPLVALFGPGDPAECRPWSARARVVAERAPCGCANPTCDFAPAGPGRCMQRIAVDAVLAALEDVMEGAR
jgi:lipopolysaccharide heptosyltransferase II